MQFMAWNDKLSMGVKAIDDDHKKLLALANHLYDAIAAERGKLELERVLGELVDYTTFHFAREEELFARTAYPKATEHKKEHDDLTRKVVEIQQRYHAGSTALTMEVMVFLKDWLFDHILGSDLKVGPHLKAKGIS
jgi:hemerythrin